MDPQKIERINQLARKKKVEGLTAEEAAEQEALRREYITEYRAQVQAMLDQVVVEEKDGTRHPLRKKGT